MINFALSKSMNLNDLSFKIHTLAFFKISNGANYANFKK